MKIAQWLGRAKERISALDAELMVLAAFREKWPHWADRSYVITHDDAEISEGRLEVLTDMLVRRIKKEPLAYILGEKEFYGRLFWVTPEVLIPRPETERLIDLIKELDLPKTAQFLEIGTGSGCIAVTLALEFPQSKVLATDISERALDIAEQNDIIHEGRAEFLQADLIRGLAAQAADFAEDELKFDVVVANLPYVNPEWEWIDAEALDYEPKTALYAQGRNGLEMYQRMFEELNEAKDTLSARYVVVEADPCQHEELAQLAEERGWRCQKIAGYALLFSGCGSCRE